MPANKPHKSRWSSKGEVARKNHGRVDGSGGGKRAPVKHNIRAGAAPGAREKRKEKSANVRSNKRQLNLTAKRFGTHGGPPRIVGFLAVAANADAVLLRNQIALQARGKDETDTSETTHYFPEFKSRLTLLASNPDLNRQVDIVKVADVVVLVVKVVTDAVTAMSAATMGDDGISEDGEIHLGDGASETTSVLLRMGICVDEVGSKFLNLLTACGMPTVYVVLQGLPEIPNPKQRKRLAKLHARYFSSLLTEVTVLACDNLQHVQGLLRRLTQTKLRSVHWRQELPYFVVDKADWEENGDLAVCGYLRGGEMSGNQLGHLSHFGTFQLSEVRTCTDPCPIPQQGKNRMNIECEDIVSVPDGEQENIQWSKPVEGLLEGEQTWPTQDELALGSSAIPDDHTNDPDEDEDKGSLDEDSDGSHNADVSSLAPPNSTASGSVIKKPYAPTTVDTLMVTDISFLNLSKEQIEAEKKRMAEERKRITGEADEQRDYPDEMDTPVYIPARQRFLRYRGMASFRTSKWDPLESLPIDYGRIWAFQNFSKTQRDSIAAQRENPIRYDQYVRVRIQGIQRSSFEEGYKSVVGIDGFMIFSGLRKHEQKFTILNLDLKYNGSTDNQEERPLKSKESVLVHVGFRVLRCNPIFAEKTLTGGKTRFLRYFHPQDGWALATVFGPVTYGPAPVLVFQTPTANTPTANLLAFGKVYNCDPYKILLKKVVLTGFPSKVHGKNAVVKYMFYNPDDIKWFKKVPLYTKYGHMGRIEEPVGTHGRMKCIFNVPVQQHDTVCMDLYKRVYPKWTTTQVSCMKYVEDMYRSIPFEPQNDNEPEGKEQDEGINTTTTTTTMSH